MSGKTVIKEHPSLTAICHKVFLSPPSGLTGYDIAEDIGKPYATLMSELSRQPGHKFGADLLLPLMQETGSDRPLHFLARQMGGVYISLPKSAVGENELIQALTSSIKEFSEFATESATDIADGKIPQEQLARILKEGHEAVTAFMGVLQLAEKVNAEQNGVVK